MEFTGCVLGEGEVFLIDAVNRNGSFSMKINIAIVLISSIFIIYNFIKIFYADKQSDITRYLLGVLLFALVGVIALPNAMYPNTSENRQYEKVDLSNTEEILITHRDKKSKSHVVTIPHLFTQDLSVSTEGMNYGDIVKIQTVDGLEYNIMIIE